MSDDAIEHIAPKAPPSRRLRSDLAVATAAMGIAVLLVLPQFLSADGDVTMFLRVGRDGVSRDYVERSFAHPVLTDDFGHDGQQFYVLASAFPDLRSASSDVDLIQYRARRIAFVALASPFPDGPPLVWGMFSINLLAIGACAVAVSRIAVRAGAPPAIGVVVGCSPAMIESLQGSLADGLAFALALWGIVLWRQHLGWGVVLFTLAALTRETALVVPLACLIVAPTRRERGALLIPFVAFGAWMLSLRAWIPVPPGQGRGNILADAASQLDWPMQSWFDLGFNADGVVTACALFVASLIAAWILKDRLPEVAWWIVFDAIVLVCAVTTVTERPMNVARVAPLVLPVVLIALFVQRGQRAPARSTSPV